jgi:hypothetical protein
MNIPSLGARYSVSYFSLALSLSLSQENIHIYTYTYVIHTSVRVFPVPGSIPPPPKKSHWHAISCYFSISESQPPICMLFTSFQSDNLPLATYLQHLRAIYYTLQNTSGITYVQFCIECGWKSRVYLHIAHIYIHAYHESIHIRKLIYICTCIDAHTHIYIYAKAEIDR